MSNINAYVWKDARLTRDKNEKQVETKLVDMDEDQLQMIYSHCKEMLYNDDPKNIGRMIIIDQIAKQLDNCGAELALRWFKTLTDAKGNYLYSSETLLSELRSWMHADPNYDPNNNYRLQDYVQVPPEFRNVSMDALQKACYDGLGVFNHSKITPTFIYNLGIYLTQSELKEIDDDLSRAGLNPDSITMQAKIDNHIKLPLGLSSIDVRVNPHGLTGTEFRDMVNMKHYKGYKCCKYSDLTTSQLHTLRFKVLRALENRTMKQVKAWKEIMQQIEEVAEVKGYKLN